MYGSTPLHGMIDKRVSYYKKIREFNKLKQ